MRKAELAALNVERRVSLHQADANNAITPLIRYQKAVFIDIAGVRVNAFKLNETHPLSVCGPERPNSGACLLV